MQSGENSLIYLIIYSLITLLLRKEKIQLGYQYVTNFMRFSIL